MNTETENTPSSPSQNSAERSFTSAEENNPVQAINTQTGQSSSVAGKRQDEGKEAVVFPTLQKVRGENTVSEAGGASVPGRAGVHVTPNLLHLVSGLATTAEDQRAAKEQRDLNKTVHQMLIIGLVISTALMLAGLVLDLMLGRELPTVVPGFMETFQRVAALRPSGFLTLGMLVLIATPILRVVGSIAAFVYEHDWRYAGVTLLVLTIVITSLVSGKG